MTIRLAENFRAVFYAPFYGCLALGFFKRAGLNIELVGSPTPGAALEWLQAGQVDVVWSGPQRAIKHALERHPDDARLRCFGEVAAKDPFYLLARPALAEGFHLKHLAHMRMGVVSEVPTPWFCLQQDLLDRGVDPSTLSTVQGMTMAAQVQALERGDLDVIQVFEPYVQRALDSGIGKIVYAASGRGWTAYTTLMSTQRQIQAHREEFIAMGEALSECSSWLTQSGVSALVESVRPYYPEISESELLHGLTRYMNAGLWSMRPSVSRAGYQRLMDSMLSTRTIANGVPYEKVVADFAYES